MVYAIHIPPPYIYMEYTWYIPTNRLVGVPDADEDSDFLVETMNPSHGHLRSESMLEFDNDIIGPGST